MGDLMFQRIQDSIVCFKHIFHQCTNLTHVFVNPFLRGQDRLRKSGLRISILCEVSVKSLESLSVHEPGRRSAVFHSVGVFQLGDRKACVIGFAGVYFQEAAAGSPECEF